MANITVKEAYQQFREYLDGINWKYEPQELENGDFRILTGTKGEDLPIHLVIFFSRRLKLMTIMSDLPFEVEKKDMDIALTAVAIAKINDRIANGNFDYDIEEGDIRFRVCHSLHAGELNEDLITYLMSITVNTVDEYNDKLFMLLKGKIGLDEI